MLHSRRGRAACADEKVLNGSEWQARPRMNSTPNSPRILYVTPFWPYKGITGVHLRCLNVLRALQQMGTVEVVFLGDEYSKGIQAGQPAVEVKVAHILEVTPRPNRGLLEKLRWTFDPESNYPYGCGVGQEGMQRVLCELDQFDLIWFFKPRAADMFPNAVWPRSVLDIDDVPSAFEHSDLQAQRGPVDRLMSFRRLFTWTRRDRLLGERFTVLSVCSEEDKERLKRLGLTVPIHVIPNGFDAPLNKPPRRPATPPRIGFIGQLEYSPNRDAVRWFLRECWPHIKSAVPDARLRLIGPGSDGLVEGHDADVDVLGWVTDPSDEMQTWALMAVPLRVGGGTRVKIAQAFSQRCPVVSTQLGAYGYDVQDGMEMYLADSPAAFSNACIKSIREPEETAQMAERAWCEYLKRWTWEAIYPRVWEAAENCLRLSRQTALAPAE